VQAGFFTLSSKVFGPGSIFGNTYGAVAAGSNLNLITVRHLLEHTAGGKLWNNIGSDGSSDPMFEPSWVSAAVGVAGDVPCDHGSHVCVVDWCPVSLALSVATACLFAAAWYGKRPAGCQGTGVAMGCSLALVVVHACPCPCQIALTQSALISAVIAARPPTITPGTKYSYSNFGYLVGSPRPLLHVVAVSSRRCQMSRRRCTCKGLARMAPVHALP
jgi:hypothetical protein